jgi:hypothetical protein
VPLDSDSLRGGAPGCSANALHQIQSRVEMWAGSLPGRAVVRELRWAVPTMATLTARLRAEMGSLGGAQMSHVRGAVARIGIPVREGDCVSWGPHVVPWEEARIAWQTICSCAPEDTMVCATCGGGRPIPAPDPSLRGICRWCRAVADARCGFCVRGLHYVGQCGMWLRGASCAFAPAPLEERPLCPDCSWSWAQELTAVSRVARSSADPLRDVAAQMAALASACAPGAGSVRAAACAPRRTRARAAARWLRRQVRRRNWISESRLIRLCAAQLCGGGGSQPVGDGAAREALAILRRGGELWSSGSGSRRAVRWHRGEAVPPVRHSCRGRRRRSLADVCDERPARRPRTS